MKGEVTRVECMGENGENFDRTLFESAGWTVTCWDRLGNTIDFCPTERYGIDVRLPIDVVRAAAALVDALRSEAS